MVYGALEFGRAKQFDTPADQHLADVPNATFMQQKKFVKVGLTTDNFKRYVPLIVGETLDYLTKHLFENDVRLATFPGVEVKLIDSPQTIKTKTIDVFAPASEITICTAAATLQGKEVRESMDKSFADLFHDLDGGFTPLVRSFPHFCQVSMN